MSALNAQLTCGAGAALALALLTLALLAANPGRVFTRNQIIREVKGDNYPVTARAIDMHMVNLRRKLGEWADHIETVRGVGYRAAGE